MTAVAAREPGFDGASLPADVAALVDLLAAEPREPCGCLVRNVEVLGHRPDCRNYLSF